MTARDDAAVLGLLGGGRAKAAPQATGPMLGTVRSTSAAGVVFVVPDYDGGKHAFGPAPWHQGRSRPVTPATDGGDRAHTHGPHDHVPLPPAAGDTCLVLFVGTGIEKPVVVAWW